MEEGAVHRRNANGTNYLGVLTEINFRTPNTFFSKPTAKGR
jgi:hypothetical protein